MDNELEVLKGDKKIPLSTLSRRTLEYIAPEKKSFILALVFVLINVILNMLSPLLTSALTDELVSDNIRLKFIINIAIL